MREIDSSVVTSVNEVSDYHMGFYHTFSPMATQTPEVEESNYASAWASHYEGMAEYYNNLAIREARNNERLQNQRRVDAWLAENMSAINTHVRDDILRYAISDFALGTELDNDYRGRMLMTVGQMDTLTLSQLERLRNSGASLEDIEVFHRMAVDHLVELKTETAWIEHQYGWLREDVTELEFAQLLMGFGMDEVAHQARIDRYEALISSLEEAKNLRGYQQLAHLLWVLEEPDFENYRIAEREFSIENGTQNEDILSTYLFDEEYKIWSFLHYNHSPERAQEFFDLMTPELQRRMLSEKPVHIRVLVSAGNAWLGFCTGVLNVVEALVDTGAVIVGGAASGVVWLFDNDTGTRMMQGTMSFVATEYVNNGRAAFYNTPDGIFMDGAAYAPFRQDGWAVNMFETAGYVCGTLAIAYIAAPAKAGTVATSTMHTSRAVVGGVAGFGNNVENVWAWQMANAAPGTDWRTWQNFGAGAGYGTLHAGLDAAQFYIGSRVSSTMFTSGGANFNNHLLNAGARVGINAGQTAVLHPLRMVSAGIYTGDFEQAWMDSGGWNAYFRTVGTAALFSGCREGMRLRAIHRNVNLLNSIDFDNDYFNSVRDDVMNQWATGNLSQDELVGFVSIARRIDFEDIGFGEGMSQLVNQLSASGNNGIVDIMRGISDDIVSEHLYTTINRALLHERDVAAEIFRRSSFNGWTGENNLAESMGFSQNERWNFHQFIRDNGQLNFDITQTMNLIDDNLLSNLDSHYDWSRLNNLVGDDELYAIQSRVYTVLERNNIDFSVIPESHANFFVHIAVSESIADINPFAGTILMQHGRFIDHDLLINTSNRLYNTTLLTSASEFLPNHRFDWGTNNLDLSSSEFLNEITSGMTDQERLTFDRLFDLNKYTRTTAISELLNFTDGYLNRGTVIEEIYSTNHFLSDADFRSRSNAGAFNSINGSFYSRDDNMEWLRSTILHENTHQIGRLGAGSFKTGIRTSEEFRGLNEAITGLFEQEMSRHTPGYHESVQQLYRLLDNGLITLDELKESYFVAHDIMPVLDNIFNNDQSHITQFIEAFGQANRLENDDATRDAGIQIIHNMITDLLSN